MRNRTRWYKDFCLKVTSGPLIMDTDESARHLFPPCAIRTYSAWLVNGTTMGLFCPYHEIMTVKVIMSKHHYYGGMEQIHCVNDSWLSKRSMSIKDIIVRIWILCSAVKTENFYIQSWTLWTLGINAHWESFIVPIFGGTEIAQNMSPRSFMRDGVRKMVIQWWGQKQSKWTFVVCVPTNYC